MRIAVIGASGFVGSTLVERLLSRHEVVPFIHSSGNAMRLARRNIELPMLNLLDSRQVDTALKGVTHVVNCSRGGDEVMLTGLKNLLSAARKQRVQRFVHLSSVAVYGDPPPAESTRESAPARPASGTYGDVKLKQDNMIAAAVGSGLPSTILCPPNIAGPYSFFLVALVDTLRAGRFALLDDGDAPCSLVDVSNLCHAIELALTNGPGNGERMFVTDDEDTSWRKVIDSLLPLVSSVRNVPRVSREQLERTGGRPSRQISIRKALKHLVSSDVREAFRKDPLWEKVDVALRRTVARLGKEREDALRLSVEGPLKVQPLAPPFDPVLCRQQLRGVVHSCELAKQRIGYKPVFSVDESMEAFRNWYRLEHGMNTPAWPLLEQLY